MARKSEPPRPSKPPVAVPPGRALKLLGAQAEEIDKLRQLSRKDPAHDAWVQKTVSVLTLIFGDPSVPLDRFKRIRFGPGMYYPGQPESEFQEAYLSGLDDAKNVLGAILFEYEQTYTEPAPERNTSVAELNISMSSQTSKLPENQGSNFYFVAHEFSASGLDDLRTAIKEALSSSGLEPYFADKEIIEGQIFINKILPKIRNCRFGIYDISNPTKPNVFIELGAAIAIGARYYIVVREDVSIPSDLQGLDRIEYRSFEHLKTQLREKIRHV